MPRKGKSANNAKDKSKSKGRPPSKGRGRKRAQSASEKSTVVGDKPKFKFVCQKCGACCGTETIFVSIADLERWLTDQTIYRLMHKLELQEFEGNVKLVLTKDDDGKCNLYHRDNKTCTIYDTRPAVCCSYPLGFNGDQYFIKNNDCPGLGQEGMTKEQLENIRNDAFSELIDHRQINAVLPLLYNLIFNKLLKDSQAFMDKLEDAKSDNADQTDNDDELNS